MSKLTQKIILEGTRLSFKTDLAFALNEHPRIVGPRNYKYHSLTAFTSPPVPTASPTGQNQLEGYIWCRISFTSPGPR